MYAYVLREGRDDANAFSQGPHSHERGRAEAIASSSVIAEQTLAAALGTLLLVAVPGPAPPTSPKDQLTGFRLMPPRRFDDDPRAGIE